MVKGIKANARARADVPAELRHYLMQPILPSGWYPEREYNVLIDLLARHIDRSSVSGDVWHFFGRTAARRDIAGEQDHLPEDSRTETAGVYRRFRDAQDLPGFFLRSEKMWGLYHDSGCYRVTRHAEQACTVVARLSGFEFPFRGLIDLQTAFVIEYARLLGLQLSGRMIRMASRGEPFCEWHYRVQHTPENVAAISKLPAPRPSTPLAAR